MFLYKLNVFHWHLTDDEGWRLEIRSLPNLTRYGAFRGRGHVIEPQYGGDPRRPAVYPLEISKSSGSPGKFIDHDLKQGRKPRPIFGE